MVIVSVEEVSLDCVKITTGTGPSFFLRLSYLKEVLPASLLPGTEFSGGPETDILDAGMAYAVERKAVSYLDRSEQCRFILSAKLTAKGFEKKYIDVALDYLEAHSWLSDARYARAWLNNRMISRSEGRSRLAAGLAARGISRETASEALDEFFTTTDEAALCRRALEKCRRLGKNEEKTRIYLRTCGFPFHLIEQMLKMA